MTIATHVPTLRHWRNLTLTRTTTGRTVVVRTQMASMENNHAVAEKNVILPKMEMKLVDLQTAANQPSSESALVRVDRQMERRHQSVKSVTVERFKKHPRARRFLVLAAKNRSRKTRTTATTAIASQAKIVTATIIITRAAVVTWIASAITSAETHTRRQAVAALKSAVVKRATTAIAATTTTFGAKMILVITKTTTAAAATGRPIKTHLAVNKAQLVVIAMEQSNSRNENVQV